MAESKLVVSDYAELLALHKTVMAAKFAPRPEHPEVCGSPLVAAVAERTVEVLRELDLRTHGEERAREWDEWQKAEPQRLEWQRALEQVNAGSRPWKDWSAEEKREFARLLLSPCVRANSSLTNSSARPSSDSTHAAQRLGNELRPDLSSKLVAR